MFAIRKFGSSATALVAAALVIAGCGSSGTKPSATDGTPVSQVVGQSTTTTTSAPPTSAAAATPSTTATVVDLGNSKLGPILVDGQGRSLYLFEADTTTTSTCTSAGCVAEWPPLIANGSPQVGTQLAASRVSTTTRADGRQQVTYSGHPLYYFAGDSQPGSTAGQGLNDNGGLWYVVHADGTPVVNS